MKKVNTVLICLIFGMTALLPLGTLLTVCFGYEIEPASVPVFASALAAVSVLAVILVRIHGITADSRAIRIITAAVAPLSLINAVFFMLESYQVTVIAGVLISAVCCCAITAKHSNRNALKKLALSISAIMALPVIFLSLTFLIFGNFGKNEVVKTVVSPNEEYYAQVINSDRGALGGDTLVDVHNNGFNAFFFKINKKTQRIYQGEWGEFNDMKIYWKDDNCLVINSVEYDIGS